MIEFEMNWSEYKFMCKLYGPYIPELNSTPN